MRILLGPHAVSLFPNYCEWTHLSVSFLVSWEDIVVGAPQFFVKDGEIGGAIYVYINKNGKWDQVTPMRINGPKDSMFGLAVENLGDINQDGYHGENDVHPTA